MSVQVDPVTFAFRHVPAAPSPVQHWNDVLSDLIARDAIGPTRSSRAYALLNAGFHDLWAASDPSARPQFSAALGAVAAADLELLLNQFGAALLARWFADHDWPVPVATAPVLALLDAVPPLDPWSNSPAPERLVPRSIDRWTPEHVPIDDPTAPLESFLTPRWGELTPFSAPRGDAWRPQGPEPFLLLDTAVASLELEQQALVLHQDWSDGDGQLHPAGTYPITDPAHQAWMLKGAINPAFIAQAEEVVALSNQLTDAQKLSAEFWESGAGTSFPPGNWMGFASWMADQHKLSLSEQVKLFFAVGQAVGDAGIAAWDAKWHFDYARPVRVIRDLAALGLLQGDNLDQWQTYQAPGSNASPPFAEYVSGHSAFSAAAAEALKGYFGSDAFGLKLVFEPGSSRFQPERTPVETTTLAWPTFTAAAESAGMSRLYGGIHFQDGNVDGLAMGETIGRDVVVAAESLAYAELDDQLLEPFRWRNQLQLHKDEQPLTLDGIALPGSLQTVALGSGDDRVQITDVTAWSGRIDAGSGSDILDLSSHGAAVEVDLSQDSLSGLLQLHDFEQVWGGPGADQLRGDEADEWFQGNGADDWLDGGAGLDTAEFSGVRADYRFGPALGQISDRRPNGDGLDQLVNIEQLSFADGEWSFNHLFRAPLQRISSGPYPLSAAPGEVLQLPVLYSATHAGAELHDLTFELRYPSDQLEFLGVSTGSELQISRAEPLGEQQNDRLLLSMAQRPVDQRRWSKTLPLQLGTLNFRVVESVEINDSITGLQWVPHQQSEGFGFAADRPDLVAGRSWSLDLDGDGSVDPLSDGLMVMRFLMGLRGDALINKALSSGADRTAPAAIEDWIIQGIDQGLLDVDADGATTALGDGLLLLRSMFGVSGAALLDKSLSPQSPLLAGYRIEQLDGSEKAWISEQIASRIQDLS